MKSTMKIVLILSLLQLGLVMSTSTVTAGTRPSTSSYLGEQAVYREKPAEVIHPRYRNYFSSRPAEPIKVWVFFTDKGFRDQTGFDMAAASVSLTERAMKRRAKVDRDRVVFADLPVATGYTTEIERIGADHRRSSRWLNAASFELKAELIDRISRLAFVAEVRPVISYRRGPEPEIEIREERPDQSLADPHSLSYGDSFWQLDQLNVPAVHDQGYSGLGVTIAFLDTGCRKTHNAFAQHFADERVLAEYDFVHNDANVGIQAGDAASEHNHGTKVWASAGAWDEGNMYGPAYRANFILCKTEDTRSETDVEEDNWVAAMEFADSVGTDVISSSVGYMIFDDSCNCDHTYEDVDGQSTVVSMAASMADGLGIVVSKSAGNSGPSAGSITPPADAFDILTVGSVYGSGTIYVSSSRGPTYDGRIKPEVCARGVNTYSALSNVDNMYGSFSGTSAAQPLIAGCVALVIEAHPDWTPHQVREALKASGNHASSPNNTYGWGVVDVDAAIQMDPECCRGIVGNVNGLGGDEPTISDVALMIDHLYINKAPINCYREADLNQSGGSDPGDSDITIGDIAILIDHLFISGLALFDCP